MRAQLDRWVDAHRDQIVAETQRILRVPSVEEPTTAGAGAPFGRPIADALEQTLALCESLGMRTENFDGYAGHAEFGEGEEIIAMLGHLDVVPPGGGWAFDPWGATLDGDRLVSRGASDDKGPTYAALFGAKAVLDSVAASGTPLRRRIRLIFGGDEESGWQCMDHYFGAAGQPKPTYAFTPDADFPLVYAEKGSFTAVARRTVAAAGHASASLRVTSFQSGLRANMVPDEAVATLEGDEGALEAVAQVLSASSPGVSSEFDGHSLVVRALGRGAHGSTPAEGVNAATVLLRALTSSSSAFDDLHADDMAWMADLARRGDPAGAGVGIDGSDDVTGALTSNLGIVTLADGVAEATFNVRYPATWDGDETYTRLEATLAAGGWQTTRSSHTPPLYVPPDQEPVNTLLRVYREQTGDMTPPKTMGGRTYATTVAPVGVAFGPGRAGDPEVAHRADEFISVERLIECAKIYAQALWELAK